MKVGSPGLWSSYLGVDSKNQISRIFGKISLQANLISPYHSSNKEQEMNGLNKAWQLKANSHEMIGNTKIFR